MTPELDEAIRLARKTEAPSPAALARGRRELLSAAATAPPSTSRRLALAGLVLAAAAASAVLLVRRAPDRAAIVADVSSTATPVVESSSAAPPSSTVAVAHPIASTAGPPSLRVAAPRPLASATALPSRGWKGWLVEGRSDEVVRAARASGEGTLATADADDLLALGDAARYEGDRPLARSAYAELRRRFRSDARASSAAFFLGRLAEGDDPTAAITDYETYLAEAPNGPWAAEAIGRLMLLTRERDPERSVRAAREYLVRQPGGPWAKDARAILGTP